MIGLLLAVPGIADEPAIVHGAAAHGLRIVRRCVDAVDLLAAAAVDPSAQIVVSAALPRLGADAVDRMRTGRRVIGLASDTVSADLLADLGVDPVLRVGASTDATLRMLAATVASPSDVPATDAQSPEVVSAAGVPAVSMPEDTSGRVVAVWGPQGAPGRTTVALGLAECMADAGRSVLLVDADTYAPSIAMALGVVEEGSGLIVACRHAESGRSRSGAVTSAARTLRPGLHLLSGLPASTRWPDLRSGALDRVWSAARECFDAVVIDIGFCLESDADGGTWGPRRNAAALTALAAADHVVAVAHASPQGAARLSAAWPELRGAMAGPPVTVVRNCAQGSDGEWTRAVRAAGVDAAVCSLPRDDRAVAGAWRSGRTLGEANPRSRLRRSLARLAEQVLATEVLTVPAGVPPWILASR